MACTLSPVTSSCMLLARLRKRIEVLLQSRPTVKAQLPRNHELGVCQDDLRRGDFGLRRVGESRMRFSDPADGIRFASLDRL